MKWTGDDYDKYITTQEFNKLTSKKFVARLAQANLASKNKVASLVKKRGQTKNLNKEVTPNKSKHSLVENEFKKLRDKIEKLQTFDSSLFIGRRYFLNDEAHLYLKFQSRYYALKTLSNSGKVISRKAKGLSNWKT